MFVACFGMQARSKKLSHVGSSISERRLLFCEAHPATKIVITATTASQRMGTPVVTSMSMVAEGARAFDGQDLPMGAVRAPQLQVGAQPVAHLQEVSSSLTGARPV